MLKDTFGVTRVLDLQVAHTAARSTAGAGHPSMEKQALNVGQINWWGVIAATFAAATLVGSKGFTGASPKMARHAPVPAIYPWLNRGSLPVAVGLTAE
ncbi:hypothetical protein N8D56_25700 (plasmid) [Devosia sp. A8/3-2]|nr:hypothetical protein N8D56_25700 [Devosia sp. A8/3-2]